MDNQLPFDPASQETREALAENAYRRLIYERAAVRREHDLDDEPRYVVTWRGLDEKTKAPFRAAVAETIETVIELYDLER